VVYKRDPPCPPYEGGEREMKCGRPWVQHRQHVDKGCKRLAGG
jgi:hypothetical protein